jgi:hypothetical protein
MKNYSKMTLVLLSFLFLLALVSNVHADYNYNSYTYTDVSDTVSYSEDLDGFNRGFSLRHTSSVPRTNSIVGCDYYDWTYDLRKCKKTAYYNGYREDYYSYSNKIDLDYYRAPYNQDQALKEAFRTYQQSSKQQYQLESQRINFAQRRYYGYGYSGARYYRFGW